MIQRFFAVILLNFLLSLCAFAAQDATVVIENAIIFEEPKESAQVLEYLPMGGEVRISSYPIEGGWYKVRARSGKYGWIHENNISVAKVAAPGDEKVVIENENEEPGKEGPPKPERDRRWFIRGMYGITYGGASDINDIFSLDEFTMRNQGAIEAGWFYKPKIALLFRAEVLYKDVVVKEKITTITYNLGVRSYPLMLGAEYYLVNLPPFKLSGAALVGLGLNTEFTTEAFNLPVPNSHSMSAAPLTALFKVTATRPLARWLSLVAEGGYRFLVTPELTTGTAANMRGGQVFIKDNVYKNRIIDLSGYVISAGLGFHF